MFNTSLNTSLGRGNSAEICEMLSPDYTAGVSCSELATANTPFTAPTAGILAVYGLRGGTSIVFTINGTTTPFMLNSESQWFGNKSTITIPVGNGDVVSSSSQIDYFSGSFYPYKGAE